MAVAFTMAGFAGTVDEIAEARRFALAAPPFRVGSVNDWAPSADSVVNRRVNISAGQGIAYGVAALTTTPDSVSFAPNNGTTNRFDAVVMTTAWAANSGAGLAARSGIFRVIPGTTAPPQVNATTTLDNSKLNRVKGIQYDALIAIVRVRPSVGLLTSGDVVDCRMWAGYEGYANTGSAQYLTSLDTQPGSLVRANDTDIVWNRLAGGTWGFEKWVGTDRTKQPMLSVRNFTTVNSTSDNALHPVFWPEVTDHSQGLLTVVGTRYVQCQVQGRVHVKAHAFSDAAAEGNSYIQLSFPAGGGDYLSTLSDMRERASGYGGAGTLRQQLNGTMVVQPGDQFDLMYQQSNTAGATLTYNYYLTVTYI